MTQYMGITGKLYPNTHQVRKINQNIGATRWVWNTFKDMLDTRYEFSPETNMPSYTKLSSLLPRLKEEYPWLKECDSIAVQESLKNLMATYQRFFNGFSKYPRFKSRKNQKLSYTSTIRGRGEKANIRFNDNQIKILVPKLGWVRVRLSRKLNEPIIKSVTITQNKAGFYCLSVLVEQEPQELPKTGEDVGIDVGLIDYASLSNSEKLNLFGVDPTMVQSLQIAQRTLNHRIHRAKIKHGKNWWRVHNVQKSKERVSRLHQKIANQRRDALHKLTTQLVHAYDTIVIEDLKVSKMMKNKHLSRSIAMASWRMFRTFLQYKCDRYGKQLIVVPPFHTSMDCSSCGTRGESKPLSVRQWTCATCHETHDRDTNAAINILNKGKLIA